MKRFQNKAAESRSTLSVVLLYATAVWLLAGLVSQHWWIQYACFLLSAFVMMELCNGNALIRIFSRMPSCTFVCLTCSACFLFSSTPGAIAGLCVVASLLTLFHCYQDKQAPGWAFYTFLLLGLGSLACIEVLWLVPVFWLVMLLTVYAMSWRNFTASLLGLLLPFFGASAVVLLLSDGDFSELGSHFATLGDLHFPFDITVLSVPQLVTLLAVLCLSLTGTIHFLRNSFRDKIRVRQLFYSLILLNSYALVLTLVQPQLYDLMLRVTIITASPLIGHFIALTSTRMTNIAFCAILVATVMLTMFNLWMLL